MCSALAISHQIITNHDQLTAQYRASHHLYVHLVGNRFSPERLSIEELEAREQTVAPLEYS